MKWATKEYGNTILVKEKKTPYTTTILPFIKKEKLQYQAELQIFIKKSMNQLGALKVNNFRKKYKSYASIVKEDTIEDKKVQMNEQNQKTVKTKQNKILENEKQVKNQTKN